MKRTDAVGAHAAAATTVGAAWLGSNMPTRRPARAGPSGTSGRIGGGALIELGAQAAKNAVEATRAARLTRLPTYMIVIDPPPVSVSESDQPMQAVIRQRGAVMIASAPSPHGHPGGGEIFYCSVGQRDPMLIAATIRASPSLAITARRPPLSVVEMVVQNLAELMKR